MKREKIEVDVREICSIVHRCNGCPGASNQCCSSYEITVEGKELQSIEGCIPLASRYAPSLKSDAGYENVFEPVARNLYSIDSTEEGVCVFAFFKKGAVLCSLHAAALKNAIPFSQAKPKSCLLWPLALSEGSAGVLSVQEDAFEFSCNTRSRKDFILCPSIAMNIEWVFGTAFRKKVQGAVDKRVARIVVEAGPDR